MRKHEDKAEARVAAVTVITRYHEQQKVMHMHTAGCYRVLCETHTTDLTVKTCRQLCAAGSFAPAPHHGIAAAMGMSAPHSIQTLCLLVLAPPPQIAPPPVSSRCPLTAALASPMSPCGSATLRPARRWHLPHLEEAPSCRPPPQWLPHAKGASRDAAGTLSVAAGVQCAQRVG